MEKLTLLKNGSFIDGQWLTSQTHFPVTNPFDGSVIANVANAGITESEQAILVASKALKTWSKKSANERALLMRKWFDLVIKNQAELARILTLEQGKPLAEAQGEIAYGASFIEWFAEEGKRIYGDTIPSLSHDKKIVVIKQPVGVVTAITPWNFPNAMIARKAAAALAAGCTFVVKPADLTPLSALALAELAQQAGIPDGVFNVVVGTDAQAIGKVFTSHCNVSKFTFTGSTHVGKMLIQQCASTVKKVSMELGGNAPFIVFDDADINEAVKGAISSKYRNAGQTCVSSNRILVHDAIFEEFTHKFVEAVQALTLGNGLAEGVDIGPLISSKALNDVETLISQSLDSGAQLLVGGKSSLGNCFYQPTVLINVTNDMPIASNEIFGPVAAIIRFNTEKEAVDIANDTEYGLAAYFYARDIGRVWRISEALDFGMVGINEGIISNSAAPFGGMKQSGSGREGSKYGLDDYLEIKYLCMAGL